MSFLQRLVVAVQAQAMIAPQRHIAMTLIGDVMAFLVGVAWIIESLVIRGPGWPVVLVAGVGLVAGTVALHVNAYYQVRRIRRQQTGQ